MKISQYDCVRLKDGREGAVIEIFDRDPAYMVEICDDEGRTLDTPIISVDEVDEITYRHSDAN